MNSSIYKEVIKRTVCGYAYHKLILDDKGNPKDFMVLDANPAFEEYTGLKLNEVINKNFLSEVIKDNEKEFNWLSLYGDVALNNKNIEFETYSDNLKRYYHIKAFSQEKGYFITVFKETTIEKRINEISKYFLENIDTEIDYQKITDFVIDITGGKYAAFNLTDRNKKEFQTVSISGISDDIKQVTKLLGFRLLNKKWKYDPKKKEEIKDDSITYYKKLSYLTKEVIPKSIINNIERMFNTGQIVIAKIVNGEETIGDFTIFFEKENKLKNKELLEIYLNQVGLFIERKKIEKKLVRQAEIDPLTEAYNRNALKNNKINDKLDEAKDRGLLSCLCIVDIDDFKDVNDGYGHQTGDYILRYISKRIMRELRKEDIFVRTGGDEFLIYLHNVKNMSSVEHLIKRLMRKCNSKYRMDNEVEREDFKLKISCSIGVAFFPQDGITIDKLIAKADSALYTAKESGNGNYALYNPNKSSSIIRNV